MKAKIGFKNKSANGGVSLELSKIVEIRPMNNCVAFMREYENAYRIEAIIPYENIAYIYCEPEEGDEERKENEIS